MTASSISGKYLVYELLRIVISVFFTITDRASTILISSN